MYYTTRPVDPPLPPPSLPQTLETFGGQSSIVQESWDVVLSKFTDLEVPL